MNLRRSAAGLAAVGLALSLSACSGEDAETSSAAEASDSSAAPAADSEPSQEAPTAAASTEAATQTPGEWIDYATYEQDPSAYSDSDVVLFFHASWCPDCQATEASLNADGAPAGLTVVQVDFDTQTDLRQEYGVTVQHTFVHVDDKGTEVNKWTGSETGADIAAEL